MTENKICVGWINRENCYQLGNSNYEARKELKSKYKILCCDKQPTNEELENNDIVYVFLGENQYDREYQLIKRPDELTNDEIALIIDGDLLYFGYYEYNDIFDIHQD